MAAALSASPWGPSRAHGGGGGARLEKYSLCRRRVSLTAQGPQAAGLTALGAPAARLWRQGPRASPNPGDSSFSAPWHSLTLSPPQLLSQRSDYSAHCSRPLRRLSPSLVLLPRLACVGSLEASHSGTGTRPGGPSSSQCTWAEECTQLHAPPK